jgi:hypothetical protein
MAIHSQTIKNLLLRHMKKGKWYDVREIQDIISSNHNLGTEDLLPHTETRPTTYPKWKHRLQGTLSGLKRSGVISHNKVTREYMLN